MLKKSIVALVIFVGLGFLVWPRLASMMASEPKVILDSTPIVVQALSRQPAPVTGFATQATPTPRAREVDLTVYALPNAAGWASSLDGRSYFTESEILAGFYEGHTFVGALQFDLSALPAGAVVTYASLQLTGRDGQSLGSDGTWQLHLLDPAVDAGWSALSFDTLRQAESVITVGPSLTPADLAGGQANVFPFGAEQLIELQSRLAGGVVSFRLDGPADGDNNIFTWVGNDGSAGEQDDQPQLHLRYVPPAEKAITAAPGASATATPLSPDDWVVVTSTPTPENIVTLAAEAVNATRMAASTGTFTPVPANWVTPIVVTPQPTPANEATAQFLQSAATAAAFLNGPASATPPNLWTATPERPTPTSTATPSPTPLTPVVVTSTPTPENIITVAAQAARATAVATAVGTFTPVPRNWVLPVVVTPQPAPGNQATATFQIAAATAEAFLHGATPVVVWTATPTPFMQPVTGDVATPWPGASATPTPRPIPQQLVGKIAFLSNRSGGPEPLRNPLVYVVDPDGGNLFVLTDSTFYDMARQRDVLSADQRFRTFVKEFPRYMGDTGRKEMVPAIFYYDYEYNVEEQVTFFGAGDAWDPVWSPSREQMAFVSNDSKDDEIWIVNRDGSGLQRLTETNEAFNAREIGKDTFIPEVNGHPSWSPDGSQLVFWSNRTGHRQIWVMNADGSNPHSLSTTGYDDWNPVWIKYTDAAH